MNKTKGQVTIPTDAKFVDETIEIIDKWGGDAIRDCDGTELPSELKNLNMKVYSTYFPSRGDNEFADANLQELQHFYVMSNFVTATDSKLEINIMNGYFSEQIMPDSSVNIKKYWQVVDRTTGETVYDFEYDEKTTTVKIQSKPFHRYTVAFLAWAIWDSTQMYNHITNDWTKVHEKPFDIRQPVASEYIPKALKKWIEHHPDTDVVRFTTFFYHFTLLFNEFRKEKFVDWFGYNQTVSVKALQEFKKEFGYELTPENFVDEGYYNSPFRIPKKEYLDYMEFIQRFVCRNAKKLVDEVHSAGKEAMMFLGDNWIGTEPYGEYFKSIGLDAVVGSVGGGATLRMISEIPVPYTEARFLPYFFPDVFCENGQPVKEAVENWVNARRAILRKPVDRIGYGGYLSLATKFPDFVNCVAKICDEFRSIYNNVKGTPVFCGLKVAVLNVWGKLRSWQTNMVAHAIHYDQTYSYLGVLEALSGLPFKIDFINFEDVKNGELKKYDVVINVGEDGTAFSGGNYWGDEKVVKNVRKFVHEGGGFIGVGGATAFDKNGSYFQLSDVMGVEVERSFSLSTNKYNKNVIKNHFITGEIDEFNFGEGRKNVYALKNTTVLAFEDESVQLAVKDFGCGRGCYISGLPYSVQNARLLLRACYYVCKKEQLFDVYNSDNPFVECSYYPEKKLVAVINNSITSQKASVQLENKRKIDVFLQPFGIEWVEV